MYWNFTSLQFDSSEVEFDSPAHGTGLKGKKSSIKLRLDVMLKERKKDLGTISQLALTLKVLLKTSWSSEIYSPRPKPASFVRTRTEVASADSFLLSLGNEKEKSPLVHEEEGCWRRRPSASLIFLIFHIFFHGKPSWLLCSCKSPGE